MTLAAIVAVLATVGPVLAAECIAVSGDRIVASEMAQAYPGFAALAGDLELVPAPFGGGRRLMSAAEAERLARRFGVEASSGGDGVKESCFTRRVRTLEPGEVIDALRNALPEDARRETQIELMDFSRYPVPVGELSFVAPASARELVLWRGAVRAAAGRSTPVWARARMSKPEKVWIAQRDLVPGRPIEPDDVKLEMRTGSPLKGGAPAAEPSGRMPRRMIRMGETVAANQTVAAPDVAAGTPIEVEARQAGVRLRFPAVAEAPAAVGEKVWLRIAGSGRRVQAQLTGPGTAEISEQEISRNVEKTVAGAGGGLRARGRGPVAQK